MTRACEQEESNPSNAKWHPRPQTNSENRVEFSCKFRILGIVLTSDKRRGLMFVANFQGVDQTVKNAPTSRLEIYCFLTPNPSPSEHLSTSVNTRLLFICFFCCGGDAAYLNLQNAIMILQGNCLSVCEWWRHNTWFASTAGKKTSLSRRLGSL